MRILQSLAAAAILFLAPTLRAQQSVAECTNISHAIFTSQDLQALDKSANLSPAQKESIEALMRDALSRARQEYAAFIHESGQRRQEIYQVAAEDTANPEAYTVARKKYLSMYVTMEAAASKKIAAIEREALGDIRTTLTPEQSTAGWSAFERFRRRLVLEQRSWGDDQGRNPRSLVTGAKLSDADLAAAEPLLATYDLNIDPLLTQRMEGLMRMNKESLEKAQTGDIDYKWLRESWQSPDLKTPAIKQLNVRTAIAIEKALSEEGRKRFLRQRVGLELSDVFPRPAADDDVRRIVKIKSLSPEQKDELQALIEPVEDAMFQVALTQLRARDDAALRAEALTEEQSRARDAETMKQYNTRLAELVKRLRTVLTADQREEIDLYDHNREGGDPFKAPRSIEEESQWNITPEKAEAQLKRLRGW